MNFYDISKKTLKGLYACFIFLLPLNLQAEGFNSCQTPIDCNTCDVCCDEGNRFWLTAEYLYWQIKDSPNPTPLIATAPFIMNRAPLIGQPGTEVLLGGKSVSTNWRSGGRFTLGYRFDDDCSYGLEANYFFLPNGSKSQSVASSGLPGSSYLSVPYFNTLTGVESSSPVAIPGRFTGLANLKLVNNMQGAELNAIGTVFSNPCMKIKLLAGFRYWNFNEKLTFSVDSPSLILPGEIYLVQDKFRTENNFYGGQLGSTLEYSYQQFFFNVTGKVALGAMCEESIIHGEFITNNFNGLGAPQTFVGGYFGLPSNIGHHKRTDFAVIPEVNLNLGYQIIDNLRIQVGYTFLYANKVLWAGKQLNRNINPTQSALYGFTPDPVLVGEPSPKAAFKASDFWSQGINVGLEFQF